MTTDTRQPHVRDAEERIEELARHHYNRTSDPQTWPTWEMADRPTKDRFRRDVRDILQHDASMQDQDKRLMREWNKLLKHLAKREQEDGHAWVDTHEAAWLVRNDLYQPGHKVIRYSLPNEDLSDATQARLARELEDELAAESAEDAA